MRITIFGNHRRLVTLAALGTLLCLTASAPARAGMADAVKAQTLPNGLRVLVLENHKAPLATFNVFYRVGSRNEQFGKTGLSHLCEHLMFKGTKKLGPEEFSNIIQQNGGMDNAFTESDFTDYFETINKIISTCRLRSKPIGWATSSPKSSTRRSTSCSKSAAYAPTTIPKTRWTRWCARPHTWRIRTTGR
jgi:hypothetical protein